MVFMVLFMLLLQVASTVMFLLVVVQFLFALISGCDNSSLRKFGNALSKFIFQSLQFLTYNSEEKPFPFADWPEADESAQTCKASKKVESVVPEAPKKVKKGELTNDEAREAEDFVRQEDA